MEYNIDEKFKEIFPKLDYNLTGIQKDSIQKVVVERKNTLAIILTGGGKSAIYWLSGKILGGITLVI